MSMTRQLRTAVKTMTNQELKAEHDRLVVMRNTVKNPMRRASFAERIKICDEEIALRQPPHPEMREAGTKLTPDSMPFG